MAHAPKDQDQLSEAEAAKRRDKVLRRMLNTPPKPHKKGEAKIVPPKRPKPKS